MWCLDKIDTMVQFDPEKELLSGIKKWIDNWDTVLHSILSYFDSKEYSSNNFDNVQYWITYSDQTSLIYKIFKENSELLQKFLNQHNVKKIINDNSTYFSNLSDLQKIFFLFNDPVLTNKLYISEWYLLNVSVFENNQFVDGLLLEKIETTWKIALSKKQKDIISRYYNCWEEINEIEYLVLEWETWEIWRVDGFWNIRLDPRVYTKWWMIDSINIWYDWIYSTKTIGGEKYLISDDQMNNVLFHELIHKLDHKYYDHNESIDIEFEWYTIKTHETSHNWKIHEHDENWKSVSDISEMKAIFVETIDSDILLWSRIVLFMQDMQGLDYVDDVERCEYWSHTSWIRFVLKKICDLLDDNWLLNQNIQLFSFNEYIQWTITQKELFKKVWLQKDFTRDDFLKWIEPIVLQIKLEFKKSPFLKDDLDNYLYSLLDILYFGN